MKIKIAFDGLSRLLCHIGFHSWIEEESYNSVEDYWITHYCQFCNKEKKK